MNDDDDEYYTEHRNDDGDLHKANGPAILWADGIKSWWCNGQPHRYYGLQSNDNGVWWIHGAIRW